MPTLSQNGDGRDLPHRRIYAESFKANRQARTTFWRSIRENHDTSNYGGHKDDPRTEGREERDWYHENAEAVKEQRETSGKQKEWYANNRIRCIEKSKRWNKENKEQRKIITERYNKKGHTTWQCNSQKMR